jgi:hypothetical protein
MSNEVTADQQFHPRTMEQWHLVRLGLNRIEQICGPAPGPWSDEATFDFRSFFLHCFHVEDYLMTFDDMPARAHAMSDPHLQLCRDLVINLKHAQMTSAAWSADGATASIRPITSVVIGADMGVESATMRFQVISGDRTRDAVDLARGCVSAWEAFGLPPYSYFPGGTFRNG